MSRRRMLIPEVKVLHATGLYLVLPPLKTFGIWSQSISTGALIGFGVPMVRSTQSVIKQMGKSPNTICEMVAVSPHSQPEAHRFPRA